MGLFDNSDALHRDFLEGLQRVLDSGDLGAFILVLANSMQDSDSHDALIDALHRLFSSFESHKGAIDAAPDDIRVFERLSGTDIHELPMWRHRNASPWQLILNPMRSLRPPRASAEKVENISREFDNSFFNFNREFLSNEILAESEIYGRKATVLYNKFPFMPYHTLLVPDRQQEMPQLLNSDLNAYIWQVTQQANDHIEGYGFGYNSIGAGASVNHLHFQGFIFEQLLPVEQTNWEHNGGDAVYPVSLQKFTDSTSCWRAIQELQLSNQPYNLLYRKGCAYLFRRRWQGDAAISERFAGAGFSELAGVINVADENDFNSLTERSVYEQLATMSTTTP